jgi:hypothetical protein
MKKLLFISIFLFIECNSIPEFQNGDIIFQTSLSEQSEALQLATKSKYSHMGIIYKQDNNLYVYEAVQPVKLTPINEWINRGEKKHYVVKRLKDHEKILTPEVLKKMKKYGERFKGKIMIYILNGLMIVSIVLN